MRFRCVVANIKVQLRTGVWDKGLAVSAVEDMGTPDIAAAADLDCAHGFGENVGKYIA